ncbi:MAG: MerC domain-containing protein [Gammaproteobacteria bacterium]
MKDQTKQTTGLIGAAITAACCLGLTVVISALTAIGLGFLIHDAILIPLFIVFIGFNLWMLNRSVKNQAFSKTGAWSPFKLAGSGGAISVLGLFLSVAGVGLATALIYIGLALFFAGNVWDYQSETDKC